MALFGKYDITATWAIVGRLLERKHVYPAPFDEDVWYAPDVIERIKNALPRQEIGSHSFDHIYFYSATSGEAAADIAQARRVHEEHGLEFTSFVFPRNYVAHTDRLAQNGIKVYGAWILAGGCDSGSGRRAPSAA